MPDQRLRGDEREERGQVVAARRYVPFLAYPLEHAPAGGEGILASVSRMERETVVAGQVVWSPNVWKQPER